MQGDDIALRQQGFETGQTRLLDDVVSQNLLTKGLGDPPHRLADRAIADNANCRAAHVADGVVEKTELVAFLPAARAHIVAVGEEAAAKRESQREDMLRDRVEGVIADIRNDDAVRLAIGLVHDIGAGRRDSDQFEIWQARKRGFAHWHLVDDGDGRILETIDDLLNRGNRILLITMRKVWLAQIGLESRTVEKDDRMLHGVIFL